MKQGILLIAGGHQYYGKMAAALAATIKCSDMSISIHLSHAGNALNLLSTKELELFASNSEIPDALYKTAAGERWFRAKTFMNELSPFDKTLFLDCDILWFNRTPAFLFKEFENSRISYSNFAYTDSFWALNSDLVSHFGRNNYCNVHSELMYFDKSEQANKFFKTAQEIYDNPKLKHTVFANSVPDELPFSIASALMKIRPHKTPYRPIYWQKHEGGNHHSIYKLAEKFYGISMAGARNTNFETDTYNILSSAAYQKLGLQHPYKWKPKKSFLAERRLL